MVLGVKSQASVVRKANPEGINEYSKRGGKAHLDSAPGMNKASVVGGCSQPTASIVLKGMP